MGCGAFVAAALEVVCVDVRAEVEGTVPVDKGVVERTQPNQGKQKCNTKTRERHVSDHVTHNHKKAKNQKSSVIAVCGVPVVKAVETSWVEAVEGRCKAEDN